MAIRMEDSGELIYGLGVLLADLWDEDRVKKAAASTVVPKPVVKWYEHAGLWVYAGVGIGATLLTAFGVWRRYDRWLEKLSTSFIYDLPRQGYNLFQVTKLIPGKELASAGAVAEAQRILAARQRAGMLASGVAGKSTGYEVINPAEIMV